MKTITQKISIPNLTKKFINGDKDMGFIDNDRLMKVAKRMKADTSLAERLHGRGSISNALFAAIEKRVNEINTKGEATQ